MSTVVQPLRKLKAGLYFYHSQHDLRMVYVVGKVVLTNPMTKQKYASYEYFDFKECRFYDLVNHESAFDSLLPVKEKSMIELAQNIIVKRLENSVYDGGVAKDRLNAIKES